MTTRMSKADTEMVATLLAKHQKKHPGCRLSERKCKSELADDCIGKGDKSEFHKTALKRKKAKRSVSFKKGTKKE